MHYATHKKEKEIIDSFNWKTRAENCRV